MPSARSLIGLAVAVFLVPAAQAATVITGWNANTCSGNALCG